MSDVEEGTCIYGDEEAPCLLLDGNAIRVSDVSEMALLAESDHERYEAVMQLVHLLLDSGRGGVEA